MVRNVNGYTIKNLRGNYKKLSNKRKFFIKIIGILLLLIIIRMIITVSVKKTKGVEDTIALPVEAVKAGFGLVRNSVFLTERLQPESEVNIFAPPMITGWLDNIYVDIGSQVQKRQVVATVDRNIIGGEYTKAIIQSPISGEVGRIYLDIGATITPAAPIMSVINYDIIKMYVNIPEKYVYQVKKDNVVLIRVESLPGEEFIGTIKKVSSTIDPLTGTFQAKVEIPNKLHKLKPGIFADIKIIVDMKDAVTVPRSAIIDLETDKPYVFTITSNMAHRVYIKPGIMEEEKIEIINGVRTNDILIQTGAGIVKDRDKVDIINAMDIGLITEKTNKELKKEGTIQTNFKKKK